MNKQELIETIANCNEEIANLRIAIEQTRARGSEWAEDTRLQMIADLEYGVYLFKKDLEKVGA